MFVVETFTVKADKVASFPCPKMWQDILKSKPELAKELKSWCVYQHSFGKFGDMIEFSEFDSFEDFQKAMGRLMGEKDFVKLLDAFFDCIVPGSYQMVMAEKLGSWPKK